MGVGGRDKTRSYYLPPLGGSLLFLHEIAECGTVQILELSEDPAKLARLTYIFSTTLRQSSFDSQIFASSFPQVAPIFTSSANSEHYWHQNRLKFEK